MLPWYAYAILTMLAFGITNFLLKYVGDKGMNSIFASGILWIAVGIAGLGFFLYSYLTGDFQRNVESLKNRWLIALPFIAGISLAVGMYTIKKAVTLGPGGPAVAISASNAIIVAILAWLVLGESLTLPKIIGMCLIMAGIFIVALF